MRAWIAPGVSLLAALALFAAAAPLGAATKTLTLQISPTAGGVAQPLPGVYQLTVNQYYAISATPLPGYRFVNWTLVGTGRIVGATSADAQLYITADSTLTANFEATADAVNLRIAAESDTAGTTQPVLGNHKYKKGDTVFITATPATNFHFVRWKDDPNAVIADKWSASTTVTVAKNAKITACFLPDRTQVPLVITSFPVNAGAISPFGVTTCVKNQQTALSAVTGTNFKFVRWRYRGDALVDYSASPSAKLTAWGVTRLFAEFTLDSGAYNVQTQLETAVTPAGGGTVSPTAGSYNSVRLGSTTTITATPATNFNFIRWDSEGMVTLSDTRTTSTNVTAYGQSRMTAVFASVADTAELTVDTGGHGVVFPKGAVNVIVGDPVTISASPELGYFFVCWEADTADSDKVVIDNPYAADTFVTLTGSAAVQAIFQMETTWEAKKAPRISITADSAKPNSLAVSINNARLLLQKDDFQAVDTAYVCVDGRTFAFPMASVKNGGGGFVFQQKGPPKMSLTLNFSGESWSFQASGLTFDGVNYLNGVDCYVAAGPPENDQVDGANYFMSVKENWTFNAKRDPTEDLPVLGKRLTAFAVATASKSGDINNAKPATLNIQRGGFTFPDDVAYNPDTDYFLFGMDELVFIFYPGQLVSKQTGVYYYEDKSKTLKLSCDFNKNQWNFRAKTVWLSWMLSPYDGLDVRFGVPARATSAIRLSAPQKLNLKYPSP